MIKTVNATEVKVVLVRNHKTMEQFAKELGVTSRTVNNWLSKGVMPSTAIEYMMKNYEIENPARVFFYDGEVT